MKKNKNSKVRFEFTYNPEGRVTVIYIIRGKKKVSLSPKDFAVKGNILTFNKNPKDYF